MPKTTSRPEVFASIKNLDYTCHCSSFYYEEVFLFLRYIVLIDYRKHYYYDLVIVAVFNLFSWLQSYWCFCFSCSDRSFPVSSVCDIVEKSIVKRSVLFGLCGPFYNHCSLSVVFLPQNLLLTMKVVRFFSFSAILKK